MLAVKNEDLEHYPLVEHMKQNNHQIDWAHVKILDIESSLKKRLLLESWYIKRELNPVNKQSGITHSPIYEWLLQGINPVKPKNVEYKYKF